MSEFTEEPNPVLQDKSLEELDRIMDDLAHGREVPEFQSEPETPPEPPPTPPTPEPETPPAPEPPPESPKEEEVPDPVKLYMEELEAKAKHFESVAGRTGGELGFLRRKMQELEQRFAGRPEPDGEPDAPEPIRPAAETPKSDSVTTWVLNQAVNQAAAGFAAAHPDASTMAEEMQAYFKNSGFEPSTVLLSNDPLDAARRTEMALSEAYHYVTGQRKAVARRDAETRRAAMVSDLDKRKAQAAPSAPSGVPPPKDAVKSIEDMDLKELDDVLARETGGRW